MLLCLIAHVYQFGRTVLLCLTLAFLLLGEPLGLETTWQGLEDPDQSAPWGIYRFVSRQIW